jgi:hypothetical protein
MGLLAQYNKAALLCLSNRLNEAIHERRHHGKSDNKNDDTAYREHVRQILEDLLEFTHRFRFEGVSNQLQARELYDYWVRHLGLKALHQSVMDEARAAHEFIVTKEEADQTEAVKRLTRYGLLFAAAGVVLGMAGAGFPVDKPLSLWLDPVASACFKGGINCVWSTPRLMSVALSFAALSLVAAGVITCITTVRWLWRKPSR